MIAEGESITDFHGNIMLLVCAAEVSLDRSSVEGWDIDAAVYKGTKSKSQAGINYLD